MKLYSSIKFKSEKKYIINFFLENIFPQKIEGTYDIKNGADYIFNINNKKLIIKNYFFDSFNEQTGYLDTENIPKSVQWFKDKNLSKYEFPVIYGTPLIEETESEIICHIDIFASAFFMLTRWEEYVLKDKVDLHHRFDSDYALAVKNDFLKLPVVDIYIDFLKNILRKAGFIGEFKPKTYDVHLSHDIDVIGFHDSPKRVVGEIGRDILKRRDLKQAIFKSYNWFIKANDPYFNFEQLMEISESFGFTSRFYFMSGGNTKKDNHYSIQDKRLKTIFKEIKERNHIIGFHPSYNSFNNQEMWSSEKLKLEEAIDHNVTEGRQHYLRFGNPVTWQLWEQNKMELDSSLGYPDKIGFRSGTSREHFAFDIIKRKALQLKEIPLIVMDTTLFKYQSISEENIYSSIRQLVDIIKELGGNFTLLWHNSSFYTYPYNKYENLYTKLLAQIR
jgi:hypothetical protein